MISFIISYFDRPLSLITCVASLLQQDGGNEIIICDNSTRVENQLVGASIENWVHDNTLGLAGTAHKVRYLPTYVDCPPDFNSGYKAQNIGATHATGDWYCFPSEDCYYVPGFSRIMLQAALEHRCPDEPDFVYCDMLYDPRYNQLISEGIYSVVTSYPRPRFMDKSNFIVKSHLFRGFDEQHPHGYGDWLFIDRLLKEGRRLTKAPGVLMAHN